MGYRKFLSFLTSIALVIASFFSVSFADTKEGSKSYTTESGITLTLPSDHRQVLWTGIDEDDPVLKEMNFTKREYMNLYNRSGRELQSVVPLSNSAHYLCVLMFESDIPSDLNGSFSDNIQMMSPDSYETTEMFGYGMVEKAGIPFYKIADQSFGANVLRLYQYSLLTGSGKMHQINFMLISDPSVTNGSPAPYSDEECKQLYELAESAMNSIKLSDELASDVVSPNGAEAFKMVTGEDTSESTNNGTSSDSGTSVDRGDGTSYPLPEGLTVILPSGFDEVLWIGMNAEDTELTRQAGVEPILQLYENTGTALQCSVPPVGADDGQIIQVAAIIEDAPSEISESAFFSDTYKDVDEEGDVEHFEILKNGVIHIGNIDLYKISSDASIEINNTYGHFKYKIRANNYSFVSESGKHFTINISIITDPSNLGDAVPYTEEDLAYLDELESYIVGGLTFDGKTASLDFPAYPVTKEGEAVSPETPETPEKPEVKPENTATKSSGKTFFKSFVGFSFPLWILLAGLVVLLIAGAKASKRKEWQEEPLSLSTSKAIQGFAAIGIILHHLSQSLLQASGPFQFLSECGVLFVGIFFFFSGYGLYTSLKTKDDYLKGFLKKRLITILIPFYMCIAVFTVASCICGTKYTPLELLSVLSGWSLINSHMWYIVEIAILYLAFFIFYKLIKNRTVATCAMSLFVLLMMGGSLYLCHGKDMGCRYWFMGEWWYNASILFIVGILVSKYQDALRKIARKAYVVLLPVFAILTGVFGWITTRFLDKYSYWSEIPGEDPRYLDKLRCLSVQVPFILCFVLFVLLVMMKVRFGNPVLKFLGSISLELYLIHNLFLTGLADGRIFKVSSPSMYILLTILMSIGAATIISGTDKYLIGLIRGKKKESSELTSTRNHAIDLMRIVMAFLVVTIHMPFSGSAGNVFITFGKTAVPFFLVVCGYMLYRDDAKELMSRLLKQTRRILIFFLASNVFYAAATALYDKKMTGKVDMSQYFTKKAIKDFLLYNFSPFSEHLWFFGSLLYALVILLILNKLKVLKPAIFAGPVLITAYVILSHMGVGESYQLRNAILVGLAYTMTGMLIRRYEKKILSIKNLHIILPVLAIGAGVAAIIELCTYKKGVAVPFVGCEILTIVLVLLCLRFPNFGMGTYAEKLGRTCSLPIYIMHIFTMMVFVMTKNDAFFGKFGAVTVFAVTAVGVALYENIKDAVIQSKN